MINKTNIYLSGQDKNSMKRLFIALVRQILEYGWPNVAWSPYLMKDKNLIEAVQRRATKFTPDTRDLPYKERLKKMKLPSLCYRRVRGDAIEAYKYTHGFYTANENLLELNNRSGTRGHNYRLLKKRPNYSPRANFYSYRIVDSWNALPSSVVNAPTLNCFKARLDKVWRDYTYETSFIFPLLQKAENNIISDFNGDRLTGTHA